MKHMSSPVFEQAHWKLHHLYEQVNLSKHWSKASLITSLPHTRKVILETNIKRREENENFLFIRDSFVSIITER